MLKLDARAVRRLIISAINSEKKERATEKSLSIGDSQEAEEKLTELMDALREERILRVAKTKLGAFHGHCRLIC
jgi:hypothetical protein